MQDLLVELLWRNDEITEAAHRLCLTLPGCQEAMENCERLAEQVRNAAGSELYDQYFDQLMRFTGYEVQAYYSLGLGLREEVFQALEQ